MHSSKRFPDAFLTTALSILALIVLILNQVLAQVRPQAIQTIDLGESTPDVELVGPSTNARFGSAIIVGDFNGDGLPDIAVGAPFATITNSPSDVRPAAGAVYVFFGRATFPPVLDTQGGSPDV
ncbi:MAG: integrin alpha, partial [Blastocatellia bacterium]